MNPLSRRELVQNPALAGAALAGPHRNAGAAALRPTGSGKRVLILGAGLAGLAAAYELDRRGYAVTVLEARTRPGGRVLTLREPFSDGLYAEAGAIFIPDDHDVTLKYARQFKLPLVPISRRRAAAMYYLRGQRVFPKAGQSEEWPLDLTAEERQLGPMGMYRKYLIDFLREIVAQADPASPDWPPERLKPYDQITFAEFLRRRGASGDAIALLRLGYLDLFGDGIDTTSALQLLRDTALRLQQRQVYSIRGGNDQLPKAFAERLKAKIRYGAAVVQIEHSDTGVQVVYRQAGRETRLAGDHLICALPFTTLRRVQVTPPFSAPKQKAIQELPYTSVSRIYLQTRRRCWRDQGLPSSVNAEPPLMWLWEPTHNQAGERGILESYTAGPTARKLTALPERERLAASLEAMEPVYPGLRDHFEGGASKCWDEDEWSRGAYAWFQPGQVTSLVPHIARAEGRVHFAGEHASAWPGWMQGALASGVRAAAEVSSSGNPPAQARSAVGRTARLRPATDGSAARR